MKGKVVNWLGSYGFIESEGQQKDIFVHNSDVEGRYELFEGEEVMFDLESTPRGPRAINVQSITMSS